MSKEQAESGIFLSYASVYQVDVEYAASTGVITEAEAKSLWPLLEQRSSDRFKSQITNLFYYGGALLVIASMTWFTSVAWASPDSLALFWLALAYVICFGYSGHYFWTSKGADPATTQLLGGLFTTVAVSVSPMATFALHRYLDFEVPYSPNILEVSTIVLVGSVAIYLVPFAFLTAPIAGALFFWSQVDLAQLIYRTPDVSDAQATIVSMWFGLLMLIVSYAVDRWQSTSSGSSSARPDFAFWGYLFGLAAFWGALSHGFLQPVFTSFEFQLAYLLINLILIGLYTELKRMAFFLTGAFGTVAFVFSELYAHGTRELNSWISVVFGAVLVAFAMYQDLNKQPSNFPFWEYMVGTFSLFCGLEVLENAVYSSELFGLLFISVHIGMLGLYVPTKQNVFIIFGTLGVLNYVDIMANRYYHKFALPIILTLLGLVLIGLAVWSSQKKLAIFTRQWQTVNQSTAPTVV